MNRQQRRKKAKEKPRALRGLTRESAMAALVKNGITPEDLEKTFHDGFKQGHHIACERMLEACYAAFALALRREKHTHFGPKRVIRMLRAVDEIILNTLDSEEVINAVFDELGVQLTFSDPFDRIREVDAS